MHLFVYIKIHAMEDYVESQTSNLILEEENKCASLSVHVCLRMSICCMCLCFCMGVPFVCKRKTERVHRSAEGWYSKPRSSSICAV